MIWQTLYDRNVPSEGEEESEYESEGHGEGEGWGVLSLNEKMEVGYLGKTSGMHLLAKPARSDGLNRGGIWSASLLLLLIDAVNGVPALGTCHNRASGPLHPAGDP